MLLHEIFDEWAFGEKEVVNVQNFLEKFETKDSAKMLGDATFIRIDTARVS